MADPVWPLGSNEPPALNMEGAFGSNLLQNTRPDAHGRFFATRWLIIIFPIVPLRRYYVRRGATVVSGRLSTTNYEFFGRSRLRVSEIVRTYVFFWFVVPGAFAGPPAITAIRWSETASFILIACLTPLYIVLFALCHTRWHPLREARWITEPNKHD